jgi:hypothetical protein
MAIQTALPAGVSSEGGATSVSSRTNGYGELVSISPSNKEFFSAVEGSQYIAVTPTPGTGIIGHPAPTTFDETKPYLLIYNGHASKTLYPQYLHLHETVASIGGARVQFTVAVDAGNRRSSAGTALVISPANSAGAANTTVLGWVGAVVASAQTSARNLLGNVVFRGTIDIIEDDYQIVWGAGDGVGGSSSRVATVAEVSRSLPPMAVPPGYSLLLHQWAAAQSTGPTHEVIFSYILR